jgi:hypothetical protein
MNFKNTVFIPGSFVLIHEIPEKLTNLAKKPGFSFKQDGINFKFNPISGKITPSGTTNERLAIRGVAQVVAPVLYQGSVLRLITKGAPLAKNGNKYSVVHYGEDDLPETLLFLGRELGFELPEHPYSSDPIETLHSPYFEIENQGSTIHYGLQICRDHREFDLSKFEESQNYGELPKDPLDVQVIVASGIAPHDSQGNLAVRDGGLIIHSNFVKNLNSSAAYPYDKSKISEDLPKVAHIVSNPSFLVHSSSFELESYSGELTPLVTTEQMRAYPIYQHIQAKQTRSQEKNPLSVLQLGAGTITDHEGFKFSPESFEIQSLFQSFQLDFEIVDRKKDVLQSAIQSNYKVPKQLKTFFNFEGIRISESDFSNILGFSEKVKINKIFENHRVSTHQSDFKDLGAQYFKNKSFDYIFALNSLWYFFRNHDAEVRSSFLNLLLAHLKEGGELFIDADTEILIRELIPKTRKIDRISGLLYRIY